MVSRGRRLFNSTSDCMLYASICIYNWDSSQHLATAVYTCPTSTHHHPFFGVPRIYKTEPLGLRDPAVFLKDRKVAYNITVPRGLRTWHRCRATEEEVVSQESRVSNVDRTISVSVAADGVTVAAEVVRLGEVGYYRCFSTKRAY